MGEDPSLRNGKRNVGSDDDDTHGGIQKRRKQSHDDYGHRLEQSARTFSHPDYTIGWICALPIEMTAARAMLDKIHANLPSNRREDSNSYTLGSIGPHNVVIACLPSYGTKNAAIVANNMSRTFTSLNICLLVGIGGGAPGKKDVRLGDVVVSTRLEPYDLGKALSNGRFERTDTARVPSQALMTAVRKLEAIHGSESSRIPQIMADMLKRYPKMASYARPNLQDCLFESTYDHLQTGDKCDECDQTKSCNRAPRPHDDPFIHHGSVASGNQVIKDGTTREKMAKELEVICFEMEGAGLLDNIPWLVIRGICDYSDSHKNKEWQSYAAATSAAYAKELLSTIETADIRPSLITSVAQSESRRKDLMASLSFDEMDSRRSTIKKAQVRTCEWLLRHPSYTAWLDLEQLPLHHGFLWINGKPGAGKSTMMKYAYLDASRRTANNEVCTSFFFNARGDTLERSTIGMYRYLLLQLLEKFLDLQEILDNTSLIPDSQITYPNWSLEILQELFTAAVAKLGQRRFTCFIDALDECDENQVRDMVGNFEALGETAVKNGSRVFICFSSRHYPTIDIQNGLKLTLEDQDGHSEDLAKYVRSHLRAGTGKYIEEVRAQILEKANGVFMWAVLVVDILNREFSGGRIFAVKNRLNAIPPKLSDLFRDILTRDKTNMADLLLCIQWILFSKRPLRREEFYFALVSGLAPEPENLQWDHEQVTIEDMDRFVLHSSKGLAELTKSKIQTVQFIHESVRDFLIKDGGFRSLWPEFTEGLSSLSHDRLKKCCNRYMMLAISSQTPLCETLPKPSSEAAKALRQLVLTDFPFLEYAVRYILHHADDAAASIPQDEFVRVFDLRTWINYDNLFEKFEIRRHTSTASLLYILAENNLSRLIRTRLYDDKSTEIQGERYHYPFFAALANGHRDAITALLQLEISVSSNDITLLLKYGRDFPARKGQTPLLWAVERRCEAVVKLLLKHGAEVDSKDRSSRTSLYLAADEGHEAMVELLLDHGAKVDIPDGHGWTPLWQATKGGHKAVVKLLLDHGAEVDLPDGYGRTPLWWAAAGGHTAVVKLLLDGGAKVDNKDRNGRTPLWQATNEGGTALVKILLDHGAEVDIKDIHGRTPLWQAEYRNNDAVVELLQDRESIREIS